MALLRLLCYCGMLSVIFMDCTAQTEVDSNHTNCPVILVKGTWWHREMVEGAYKALPLSDFDCVNRTVYKMMKGLQYIYYISGSSWRGWLIGENMCRNSGTVSVFDNGWYLDDVNQTWEEYAGFTGWHLNDGIQVGCQGQDGKPLPPRVTTLEPPKPPDTTPESKTTKLPQGPNTVGPKVGEVKDSNTQSGSLKPFNTVLYVVIPVGCIVMLILVVVVAVLFVRRPPYYIKEDDEQSVHYDCTNGRVRSVGSSGFTELDEDEELFEPSISGMSSSTGSLFGESRPGSLRVVHKLPDLPPRPGSDSAPAYSRFGDKLSGGQ